MRIRTPTFDVFTKAQQVWHSHCHAFCRFANHFLKKATHFNDFCHAFSGLQIEAAVKFGLPEY